MQYQCSCSVPAVNVEVYPLGQEALAVDTELVAPAHLAEMPAQLVLQRNGAILFCVPGDSFEMGSEAPLERHGDVLAIDTTRCPYTLFQGVYSVPAAPYDALAAVRMERGV